MNFSFTVFFILIFKLNCFSQWHILPAPPFIYYGGIWPPSLSFIKPIGNGNILYSAITQCGSHWVDFYNFKSNDDLASASGLGVAGAGPVNYATFGIFGCAERNKDTFAVDVGVTSCGLTGSSNYGAGWLNHNGSGQFTNVCYRPTLRPLLDISLTKNHAYYAYGRWENYIPFFTFYSYNISNSSLATYTNVVYEAPGKMQFVNDSVGYMLCKSRNNASKTYLAKTTNYGALWNNLIIDSVASIKSFHFPSLNTGYVLYSNGTILKTVDGGNNWLTNLTLTGTNTLNCIRFINDSVGYVGGNNGYITKTISSGANWLSQVTTCTNNIMSLYSFDTVAYFMDHTSRLYKNSTPIAQGVNENKFTDNSQYSLFPNPTIGNITINFNKNYSGQISVINTLGQLILITTIDEKQSVNIDLSAYAKGIYVVKFLSDKNVNSFIKVLKE